MAQVQLILERLWAEPRWGRLPLPSGGVAFLTCPREGEVAMAEREADAAVAMEVLVAVPPRIAMRCCRGRVTVNGRAAPHLSQLRNGDEIQFPDRPQLRLHVALFHEASVGPAGEEVAGRDCPICRQPLLIGQSVYRCPNCGTAMHSLGGQGEAEQSCARAGGQCPDCRAPVAMRAGYKALPEGCDAELLEQ